MAEQTIYKRTSNKRGHNKGIARRARERRHEEAVARNEKTLPENRRAYRRTHGA